MTDDVLLFYFQSLNLNKGPAPSLPTPTVVSAPSPSHRFDETDENEPSYGMAMYDFDPIQDGDLGLRVSFPVEFPIFI